jgi:hypothetical protein
MNFKGAQNLREKNGLIGSTPKGKNFHDETNTRKTDTRLLD